MASKSTAAEVELRITTVFNMLLAGAKRADIIATADKKSWGVTDRQIDNYISDARVLIAEYATVERSKVISYARARLEFLFKLAVSVSDVKTALATQREINQLEGLYAPPAERTLRLVGMTAGELNEFAVLLEENDINLAEVIGSMRARLAQQNLKRVK